MIKAITPSQRSSRFVHGCFLLRLNPFSSSEQLGDVSSKLEADSSFESERDRSEGQNPTGITLMREELLPGRGGAKVRGQDGNSSDPGAPWSDKHSPLQEDHGQPEL